LYYNNMSRVFLVTVARPLIFFSWNFKNDCNAIIFYNIVYVF
jgi:hypothetical protein